MNILHLHTGLNITCGISKTIYLIAKYPIGKNNHFVLALNGDALEKFKNTGIQIDLIGIKNNSLAGFLKAFFYIKKLIKKNKIDVVHAHNRYCDLLAYYISYFCKIKRVTSVQSLVYGKKSLSYKSPLLLAAGDSVKEHLIEYFKIDEKRIKVFNNFIDIKESKVYKPKDVIRNELGIDVNTYIIGYVGRFSIKEKGIDILLKAFEKFGKKHQEAKLVMAGSGEDIGKLTLPEGVIVSGAQVNVFDYYNIFDCLVLPSRIDPFPLTVLEAGMMRVPFIGSDVDGISEIIDNNKDGLLFEKNNPDMLFEKMEYYYNNKNEACTFAGELQKKILEKYNCEKSVSVLNDIYENL